jgi:hypothetical protein
MADVVMLDSRGPLGQITSLLSLAPLSADLNREWDDKHHSWYRRNKARERRELELVQRSAEASPRAFLADATERTNIVVYARARGMNPYTLLFGNKGGMLFHDYQQNALWTMEALQGPNTVVANTYQHLVHILEMDALYNILVPVGRTDVNAQPRVVWSKVRYLEFTPDRVPVLAAPAMVEAQRDVGSQMLERLHGARRGLRPGAAL